MIKVLVVICLLALAILAGPVALAQKAQDECTGAAASSAYCQAINPDKNPLIEVISDASKIIAFVGGFLAILFIVYSGLRFVVSAGDSAAAAKARSTLLYSVVGLVVIIFAQILVLFVLNLIKNS